MEDCIEIVTTLSQFNNIDLDPLIEELAICDEEIASINNELNERLAIARILADRITQQTAVLEKLKDHHNQINIEVIKAKTKLKKLVKNIDHLKSLNSTSASISVSDNDKFRIADDRALLHLIRELTQTQFNATNGVVVVNSAIPDVSIVDLTAQSKVKNRNQLWNAIERTSTSAGDFERIFFS